MVAKITGPMRRFYRQMFSWHSFSPPQSSQPTCKPCMPAISLSPKYGSRNARLFPSAASAIFSSAIKIFRSSVKVNSKSEGHVFTKREPDLPVAQTIAFAILIPVLVLLSGVFAGLMLGYMSLDETQLHVLSISGTP